MPKEAGQFDTSIEIITPENIAFRHRVAGPFRRLPAYLIDVLIQGVIAFVGFIALVLIFGATRMPITGVGVWLVLWFLLNWFYGGLFETYWNGQTPGKRLMQIRVVSVDGQPINGLQAVLRNIMRILDGQPGLYYMMGPFMYQVGLLAALMNDRFQRLGDLICGTMVVVEERHWLQEMVRTGEPEVTRMAARIPANFQASRTLGRALAGYVQRRRSFSWGRRLEIARHLAEPLRVRFGLPANTNLDLLLCAVYHHTFITDRPSEPVRQGSPFMQPPAAFPQFDEQTAGMKTAIIVSEGEVPETP